MFDRNVFLCAFTFLLAGIIVRFVLQKENYFSRIDTLHEKKTEQHIELIVGILSARENFEQRKAIRETWLAQKEFSANGKWKNLQIKPWFILGSQYCNLPPIYRRSKYSCEKWVTNASDVEEKFFTSFEINDTPCHPENFRTFHQGFSFQVHHPVIVKYLGVFSKLLYKNQNVSVALLDLRTKDIIVKTVISSQEHDSVVINGFLYNAVETFLLPKGYEGLVLVEGQLLSFNCGNTKWYNDPGVISFSRVYSNPEDVETVPYSKHLNVAPSIGFSIHEITSFINIISSETSAVKSWQLSQKAVSQKLKVEANKWKDMLFFDVVDTYRNIPLKLLQFYSWLSKIPNFSYLLKTDDDCMVDMSSVVQELKENSIFNLSGMWWWSRFRSQWPVNYCGKWADYDYKSPIYPPFPCGGGYVLSKNVVSWIATNAASLFPYQGEDVSMGIWLAAINPLYVKDERWQCDISCSSKSFNRAQLTVEEMHNAWSFYQECGNMCSCNKNLQA